MPAPQPTVAEKIEALQREVKALRLFVELIDAQASSEVIRRLNDEAWDLTAKAADVHRPVGPKTRAMVLDLMLTREFHRARVAEQRRKQAAQWETR